MSARPAAPEESSARSGIPLGSILGVPVTLAWSWFIIAAFVVFAFGPDVARALPGIGYGAYGVALAYAVLLLLSVLVHELAHAWLAKAYGWPGARIVLTLWGGHTQFGSFHATPGRSLAVALAGPAANFIIAGLGLLVQTLLAPGGVAGLLLNILVLANFLVAVFNILPGLPLDGGRLVESLVWRVTGSQERGTIAAGWAGRIIAVGLVVAFIGWPLYRFGTVDFSLGIVGLLVAGFLFVGANASMRDARMRLRLPKLAAGALATPAVGLRADASVADVVERGRGLAAGTEFLLVGAGGQPEAVIDPPSFASVPRELHGTTAAASVARALAPGAVVREDAAGQPLIQYLASLKGSEYAVVDLAGRVTGLLRQETVVRAITGR
ncbi:site-2 protease family protein [Zhihengliuella salsuginis]|uniref:site-2 protease family protein n=1 Tax=Zhihengliuella salsuginis TaxID=578222 RepID=UPI0016773B15|nr:site-2 protease family protein [Zhihengliuella salsuginis]